jgi:hypothetical protein
MKTLSTVWVAGFIVLGCVSCQTKSDVTPAVDPRDARVGLYVCNVKVGNFQTKENFSSYVDTLDVSKLEDTGLLITSRKKAPLPSLNSMDAIGRQYGGLATVLVFNQGQTAITDGGELVTSSGLDTRFYEYKGNKLK